MDERDKSKTQIKLVHHASKDKDDRSCFDFHMINTKVGSSTSSIDTANDLMEIAKAFNSSTLEDYNNIHGTNFEDPAEAFMHFITDGLMNNDDT